LAARLKQRYEKEVAPTLRKELSITNPMAVPRLEKIILNMGLGEAVSNPKFLDRLINIALPRVRDFRGVPTKAFDGRGNYTLGIRDHFIFPEIDYAKTDKSKGLNVTIVTTAGRDDRAKALLTELGMPFAK
jgi:large subunit ribosomal protein L5